MINIQIIDDNECFKWRLVRYLNPADRNLAKTRDVHKVEKMNSIGISVFGYENKEKHPICISKKCCKKKHVDLLLIEYKGKRHYVPIKDFNIFMSNHTLIV